MSKKEDRRVKMTKLLLKESLIHLMEKKDINKITITEICHDADINRATFYAHFSDQFNLLSSIEEEYVEKIMTDLNYSDRDKEDINQFIWDILIFIRENDRFSKVLLSDREDISFIKRVLGLVYDRFFDDIDINTKEKRHQAELIFSFVLFGCVGIIQKWIREGYLIEEKQLAILITELATYPRSNLGIDF